MAVSGRERSPTSYTRIASNPSLRKEVSILRGIFSSSRNVRGRAIMRLLPHHHIFQRIGVTLHILNMSNDPIDKDTCPLNDRSPTVDRRVLHNSRSDSSYSL